MLVFAAVAAAVLATSSPGDEERPRVDNPAECHWREGAEQQWEACAERATIGSAMHVLANMNLGTQAFLRGDMEMAARFYEFTAVDGQKMYGDPFFHAFRGVVFDRIGRGEEALADARKVLEYIELGHFDPELETPLDEEALTALYVYTLEVLANQDAPELDAAVSAYGALPTTTWIDAVNRAAVLTEIGLYDDAVPFSEAALKEQPEHPGLLNNHCYLLALMGDGEAAVPYCERAVAADPFEASFHDSLAEALNAAGRCAEAVAAQARAAQLEPSTVGYKEPLSCEGGGD